MEKGNVTKRNLIKFTLIVFVFAMLFSTETQAAKLNKTSLTLVKGKTYTLKLKGTKKKATWKTKDKKIAKLTSKKKSSVKIKAVKAGKTTITAKVGKKTYKCRVTVINKSKKKKTTETSGSKTNTDKKNEQPTKEPDKTPVTTTEQSTAKKKVWVITKWAKRVGNIVYVNKRSQWECTCGHKTEDFDEAVEHQDNHLLNEEPSAWRVNTIWDSSYTVYTDYPEEGYWMEVEEYPKEVKWRSDEAAKSRKMKDITTGTECQPTSGYYYIDKSGN